MYQLKALRKVLNEVNSGRKAKGKVGVMFFEVKIQKAMSVRTS